MTADNLSGLLDALSETSVYVIDENTRELLYCNRRCRDTGRGRAVIGAKCFDVWPEKCASCPLEQIGSKQTHHVVCFDPIQKTTVDITANRIQWNDQTPAVVVTSTPHRLNFEEAQGPQKIERMYAQSLVTVFNECIIANLTEDYYVNCQKDMLWTDIPEQGNFGAENRRYAKKTLHPDDLPLFEANFSREAMLQLFGEGKKQIIKRMRRLVDGGVYHMVEFSAARIERLGEDECWCVLIFRDIQEEYQLEQQRNVEVSQLATAAQTAYQMVIAVNLTKNTFHMLEYEREQVPKPGDEGAFQDLIEAELRTVHPEYRDEFNSRFSRNALIDAFTNGERIVSMRVPHLGENGEYRWHFTQVVRVESPHTDDLIEITLSRNIDDERRMQEEALQKERKAKLILEDALQKAENASQAKSDFLSRMSHDIRTPLNAIIGMTELAQLHLGDTGKQRDYLQKIADSGAHLLGLINDVLDVSKIESGAVELTHAPFDLRDTVREVVSMVRLATQGKGQSLSVHVDKTLHPRVIGDATRLSQVLVNILENASKYTEAGGTISLYVDELKKWETKAGTYRFVIEDTGVGMEPAYVAHIFEPFSRAEDSRISKIAGTGLGMTIVKNIVSLMNGDIKVESDYGKGSRFTVTLCLPRCDEVETAPLTESSAKEALSASLRVLLVEDNELNRQIATEMLELLGARVETAEDGAQAINAICSHPPLYYDIVFMDVQMPVLNGYEATRAIRRSGMERIDELPIIAMTADAFAEDAQRARLSGMNGHLAKPISIDQLKNALISCSRWKTNHQNGIS